MTGEGLGNGKNELRMELKYCERYPLQFDILKIGREKRTLLTKGAPKGALSVFGVETGKFSGSRVQMKKSKPKAAATKEAKRRTVRTQKPTNPADLRQSVTDMVESEMKNITRAVVEEAKKGQLATVKYLFEVSGVYPAAADARQAPLEEGEPLARILLTRMGLPLEPAISADDEVPDKDCDSDCEEKGQKRSHRGGAARSQREFGERFS